MPKCVRSHTTANHSCLAPSPKVIDARFQQAVKEVGSLPKDGPVSVSQEDQLNVSRKGYVR